VDGNGGPDSLINLVSIQVDKDGNGIPDPTLLITEIAETKEFKIIPSHYSLAQNYPNPFNPITTIQFSIPAVGSSHRGSKTLLYISDILGRRVATLAENFFQPGEYSIQWYAAGHTSGIYFYTLKSGEFNATKKLLLLK
jgi:hypothetical protein